MMAASYPAAREADIALRDGSIAHVRPIRPDDEELLLDFFQRLSPEDRRLRFLSLSTNLAGTAHDAVDVDYVHSFGLLAAQRSYPRGGARLPSRVSLARRLDLTLAVTPHHKEAFPCNTYSALQSDSVGVPCACSSSS